MVTIKRLSTCTFDEATYLWNEGFSGYYFNIAMTVDAYTARLGMEGLSPALSVVAFVDGKPAGFTLNGVRMIDGRKVAWNGGTAVLPGFRRQGVGKALMEATLNIYREEKVEVATLEAIRENSNAIALYRQMGYAIADRLVFHQRHGAFAQAPFRGSKEIFYRAIRGIPADVRDLSFYRNMAPWQTQWASVRDGESLVIIDSFGEEAGYTLFKRFFDESARQVAIALYQCEVKPEREDADAIASFMLAQAYAPFDFACRRYTVNIPASNARVLDLLEREGFTPFAEQVFMVRLI